MTDIEKFLEFLDNINNMIDISLNTSLEKNSEILEIKILDYIQENYSFMVVPKGPILELVNNGYKPGTEKYKEYMKFKTADVKYILNSNGIDLEKALQEEINKLIVLFNSISLGSNINYLDYIKNTLGNIMKYLMEKSNGSMSFAKKSMQIRNDIEKIIEEYFKYTMNDYGEGLKLNLSRRINRDNTDNYKINYVNKKKLSNIKLLKESKIKTRNI